MAVEPHINCEFFVIQKTYWLKHNLNVMIYLADQVRMHILHNWNILECTACKIHLKLVINSVMFR